MRHSKEEILNILEQLEHKKAEELESETLDFKKWTDKSKELYKMLNEYAVCFANQNGGTLVLGVDDRVKRREKAITGCSGYNVHEMKSRIYEATDPTIAGILLIGKEDVIEEYVPSHEVTYLHMKSDIKYDKRSDYKNGLLSILEDVYQNVELYNKVTTVKIGLFHFEIKDFPEDTYREVILNAVLHRDYSETAAIFIRHFKDRLEISNPDFSLN